MRQLVTHWNQCLPLQAASTGPTTGMVLAVRQGEAADSQASAGVEAAGRVSGKGRGKTAGGKASAVKIASDKQPAIRAAKQASNNNAPVPQAASAQDPLFAARPVARSQAAQTSSGAVTQPASHDSAAGMKRSAGKQSAVPKTPAIASPAATLPAADTEPATLAVPTSLSAALQPDVEGSDDRVKQTNSQIDSADVQAGTAAAGSQHGRTSCKSNKRKKMDVLSEDDRARRLYGDRNFVWVGLSGALLCMLLCCPYKAENAGVASYTTGVHAVVQMNGKKSDQ